MASAEPQEARRASAEPRATTTEPQEATSEGNPWHRLAVGLATFTGYGGLALSLPPDLDMGIGTCAAITALGGGFSHWRRDRSNWPVKVLLAVGMLWALYATLADLLALRLEPRLGLARLLMWLQVLNSFDLPRRQNLRIAILVSAILMVVTGTLIRGMEYGGLLLAFLALLLWARYEDFRSAAGGRARDWREAFMVVASGGMAALLAGALLFLAAPRRQQVTVMAERQLMSIHIPIPRFLDPQIRNTAAAMAAKRGHAERGAGYLGFSSQVDLDVRALPNQEVVLRIRSPHPRYWRAMAFDRFDGRVWTMSDPKRVSEISAPTPPIRFPRPHEGHFGETLLQTVYVESDTANAVFAAPAVRELYFPADTVELDPYGSIRTPFELKKGMYYSALSFLPRPDRQALARAPFRPAPPAFSRYLEVPRLTPRVRELLTKASRGAPTPYRRLRQVEVYLPDTFAYRLDIPHAAEGQDLLDRFFFVDRAGFCEQFATALAISGRLMGIPTRLVTGYTPGQFNPFTGLYEIHGGDAHAWVEAWFPTEGWLPFDATPGGIAPEAESSAAPGLLAATLAYLRAHLLEPALWGLALGGVGLLLALARALRGGRRLPPPLPPTVLYRRVRTLLARRGLPADPAATPAEWCDALEASPDLAPLAPLARAFVAAYEHERWGTAPSLDPKGPGSSVSGGPSNLVAPSPSLEALARALEQRVLALPPPSPPPARASSRRASTPGGSSAGGSPAGGSSAGGSPAKGPSPKSPSDGEAG